MWAQRYCGLLTGTWIQSVASIRVPVQRCDSNRENADAYG